jgi:DNA helicase-2/ATP-dependent DNA helicase PcrA
MYQNYLKINQSKIGQGTFTTVKIPANVPVCEITGTLYDDKSVPDHPAIIQIGRKKYPYLRSQADKKNWSDNLKNLAALRAVGTIGEMLDFLVQSKTPQFPTKVDLSEDRYHSILLKQANSVVLDDDEKEFFEKHNNVRAVSYQEVISLGEYIDEKTPFSTKHGVKGAEFDNVLVVFGRGWNHYNWNQMLEWFEDGIPNGEDEKFERNRNLFYVSCSRAKHNLTLLFTQELSTKSLSAIQRIFGAANIIGNPI